MKRFKQWESRFTREHLRHIQHEYDYSRPIYEWPCTMVVNSYSQAEIQEAIDRKQWQQVRVAMKGLSTPHKLAMLYSYAKRHPRRADNVCVSNYINALKRGGQLNLNLKVVK